MSRTKKRSGNKSPIKKYIEYKAGAGVFRYYDKSSEDYVELDSIEKLIILDVRYSITGFNSEHKAGIVSNMVSSLGDELSVCVYKNRKKIDIVDGFYTDIKTEIREADGKFTQNVIGLLDLGDGNELVNVQLSGAGNSSWISFTDEYPNEDFYNYAVTLKRGTLSKSGEDNKPVPVTKNEEKALDLKLQKNPRAVRPVWFYTIEFKVDDLTEEQSKLATEEDEKLQAYFEGGNTKESESEEEDEMDDLPF